MKTDTEFKNGRPDFREALIKRLQETRELAAKSERKLIESMIKWLVEDAV